LEGAVEVLDRFVDDLLFFDLRLGQSDLPLPVCKGGERSLDRIGIALAVPTAWPP